jgi:ArsR family transcriptional regulator, arsenate/arsenite/antimonite-responsive transcriptional repressor
VEIKLLKALADDTRLALSLLIHQEGELCVCELTHALALSQPKVSRHLAILKNANVLQDKREGQWIYYRIHGDVPKWLPQLLSDMSLENKALLQPLSDTLEQMGDRPQRLKRCC